jgi:hypothetical protein
MDWAGISAAHKLRRDVPAITSLKPEENEERANERRSAMYRSYDQFSPVRLAKTSFSLLLLL